MTRKAPARLSTKRIEHKSAADAADAWLHNRGEAYFFQNVRCGIRTPDDGAIWKRIEEHRPGWLNNTKWVSGNVAECLLPECQHLVELTAIDHDRAYLHLHDSLPHPLSDALSD